jgi:hypothetical protein
METKTETLLDTLKKIQCIEIFSFHAYNYLAPRMSDYKFDGDSKFAKAFSHINTNSGQHFIHITIKEGEWNYRREISAYEFAKFFGIEILSTGLKAFTAKMFGNENGWGKDAAATIADNSKEVYASFEDGERYWKNLVAQEAEIEKAKADKVVFEEALKKWNASQAAQENTALDA